MRRADRRLQRRLGILPRRARRIGDLGSGAWRDPHSGTDGDADADHHADLGRDTDTDTDTGGYGYRDAHAHADGHAYAYAYVHSDSDADADSNADARAAVGRAERHGVHRRRPDAGRRDQRSRL